jgi:hypothetical protein
VASELVEPEISRGLPGGPRWYLVRLRKACGAGTWGSSAAPWGMTARDMLDLPAGDPCR